MKIIARLMRYLLNYWMEIKSALKIQNKICKENSWQTIFHIYWTFFLERFNLLDFVIFSFIYQTYNWKIRMLQLIRGLIEQHSSNKEYICKKKNKQTKNLTSNVNTIGTETSVSVFSALKLYVPRYLRTYTTCAQQPNKRTQYLQ